MQALRLGKNVRRVTVIERDAAGATTATVVFEGKKGKRKQTQAFRPLEQIVRRIADAQAEAGDVYVTRHNRSNRKKRDGWMRDMNLNLARASRKGAKRLRVNRWLTF
ncbi:MAG: hypothetical protein ABI603_00205 [Acidobacteriota bacterium]